MWITFSYRNFSRGTRNSYTNNQIIAWCIRCCVKSNTSGIAVRWKEWCIRFSASEILAEISARYLPLMKNGTQGWTIKIIMLYTAWLCAPTYLIGLMRRRTLFFLDLVMSEEPGTTFSGDVRSRLTWRKEIWARRARLASLTSASKKSLLNSLRDNLLYVPKVGGFFLLSNLHSF